MGRFESQLSSIVERFVDDFRKVVRNEVREELREARARSAKVPAVRERLFNTRDENRQEVREEILGLLRAKPRSIGELASTLQVGRRRVVAVVQELRNDELVEQVGSGRSTKYRLGKFPPTKF